MSQTPTKEQYECPNDCWCRTANQPAQTINAPTSRECGVQTPTKDSEDLLDAFERSSFGIELFNLYTYHRYSGLLFSNRRAVVRAMLVAMVEAEAIQADPAINADLREILKRAAMKIEPGIGLSFGPCPICGVDNHFCQGTTFPREIHAVPVSVVDAATGERFGFVKMRDDGTTAHYKYQRVDVPATEDPFKQIMSQVNTLTADYFGIPRWRPMDNAPTDGTVILVDFSGVVATVFWYAERNHWRCNITGHHIQMQAIGWMPAPVSRGATMSKWWHDRVLVDVESRMRREIFVRVCFVGACLLAWWWSL